MVQIAKNRPAMQEMRARWATVWEDLGGLSSMGSPRVGYDLETEQQQSIINHASPQRRPSFIKTGKGMGPQVRRKYGVSFLFPQI